MFAVRNIFAQPERPRRYDARAAAKGAGRAMARPKRQPARLSDPRRGRAQHHRGRLPLCAPRARRRRRAVRHRRRRTSARPTSRSLLGRRCRRPIGPGLRRCSGQLTGVGMDSAPMQNQIVRAAVKISSWSACPTSSASAGSPSARRPGSAPRRPAACGCLRKREWHRKTRFHPESIWPHRRRSDQER